MSNNKKFKKLDISVHEYDDEIRINYGGYWVSTIYSDRIEYWSSSPSMTPTILYAYDPKFFDKLEELIAHDQLNNL